jgi:predicted aspartyl protease
MRVVNLIYDTGADTTTITREALMRLGYTNFAPSGKVKRTASDFIEPFTCVVTELIIGNQFRLRNMKVDVSEHESTSAFDGVIGMDFISLVETEISGKNGTVTIST